MNRSVAVSFSTTRWSEIARGLREALAEHADHDPVVSAWARSVARDAKATTDRDRVLAVVSAVGRAVKEGDPGEEALPVRRRSAGARQAAAAP